MRLIQRCSSGANIIPQPNGWHLEIPAGTSSIYRFAQLDNYTGLSRGRFPSRPPLTLNLSARASSNSIPGTWGFGLWNDPFGMSFGFGGNSLRFPTLPNATWFFHASEENWLSFTDHPGNGFLAQVFHSPAIPPPLLGLLCIPLVPLLVTRVTRKWIRHISARIVDEDAVLLDLDATGWHDYRMEWRSRQSLFWVDDKLIMESPVNPAPPLGLVIWLDNQYAAFTPDGKMGFGTLNNEYAWLEIANLEYR